VVDPNSLATSTAKMSDNFNTKNTKNNNKVKGVGQEVSDPHGQKHKRRRPEWLRR
jgi:hypothetical protein